MEYKGYLAKVEFDDDANLFHGKVINTRDLITFEGDCVADLRQALVDSVEDYLDFCAQRGEKPDKPYSGKLLIRTDPDLHKRLSMMANQEGISINQWVNRVLEKELNP